MTAKNKKNLGIHLGLVLAELLCISGFFIEYSRATSGNALSWAYVIEWPALAIYALFMWRKMLRDQLGEAGPTSDDEPEIDAALERYNDYLRRVHRGTDPGSSA